MGFDDALERFLKTPLRPRAFFANFEYDHEYFLKISFIFSKQSRCHLPDSYGDLQAEQSSSVMVRRKVERNLTSGSWRDRALNSSKDRRSSSRSVRVAHCAKYSDTIQRDLREIPGLQPISLTGQGKKKAVLEEAKGQVNQTTADLLFWGAYLFGESIGKIP